MKRFLITVSVVVLLFLSGRILWQFPANAQGGIAKNNGDCNGDGRRDISDAIYLLEFLFRGGPSPAAFAQDGNDCLQCDSSNSNVGIGTSNPIERLHIEGNVWASGPGAIITVNNTIESGNPTLYLRDISGGNRAGRITTNGPDITLSPSGTSRLTVTNGGNVGIGTDDPQVTLHINGTSRCKAMEIEGGADLAEPFDIGGQDSIEPGMVVAIDPKTPGKLILSRESYDTKVAGIISGANGLLPGLILKKHGSDADGDFPIAMTGRVWCWCEATCNSIEPGDLLTTSDTIGHAMKAKDSTRAGGAVLGKAMSSLQSGRGLVLVLVSLQ